LDFWSVILLFAAMAGLMGWTMAPFTNAVWWYCTWREGADIDFGWDLTLICAVPFTWMFAIFEIALLYCK